LATLFKGKKKMKKRAAKEEKDDGFGAGGGGGRGHKKKKSTEGMGKAESEEEEEEEEEEEDRKMTPSEHEIMELNEEIKALKARIAKLEDDYDKCADEGLKKDLLEAITEARRTLNRLLDQKARAEQGQFF
jgi:ribosomal 50S subunit-associated protein YjgA (DUF615 family)